MELASELLVRRHEILDFGHQVLVHAQFGAPTLNILIVLKHPLLELLEGLNAREEDGLHLLLLSFG